MPELESNSNDYIEVYERYGDCDCKFMEYSHGYFTFVGITPLKDLVLCIVVKNVPNDFTFTVATIFKLSDLPFSEVLVYNPDNEVVAQYKGVN